MTEKSIIEKLSEPLTSKDVQIYCKKIFETDKGKYLGLFLIYKTSRVVIDRLNSVCGLKWKERYFYDENKNLCCGLSVYDPEIKEWIERVGVGTANDIEKEKSSYSDALKRASTEFGIGTELYKMPNIFVELDKSEVTDSKKGSGKIPNPYTLNLKGWSVEYEIKEGKISNLKITNEVGIIRWGK